MVARNAVKHVQVKRWRRTSREAHRVADERLTAATLVLFLLAADVVEGEEQVVSLGQTGRQSQFHLFVEVWRPAESNEKEGATKERSQQGKEWVTELSELQIQWNWLVDLLVVVGNGSVDFLEEFSATRFAKNDLKMENRGGCLLN